MADEKIKVGDIEGNKDAVLDFIKESGADIPRLLNTPKSIKIPFYSIIVSFVIFLTLLCILSVSELYDSVYKVLSILCIADSFVLLGLIYMSYNNKILTGIVAFGEVVLLSVSLGIYSPKEAVEKIGEKLEDIIKK
jgi:hypothetical protein